MRRSSWRSSSSTSRPGARASTESDAAREPGPAPRIENLFGVADTRLTWERIVQIMTDEPRFETGLDMLLDGIEARLVRDGAL